MPSIHVFVHGRGRGHATRSRVVIDRLRREGYTVSVSAGGEALAALGEAEDSRRIEGLLPDTGLRTPLVLAKRVWQDGAVLRREQPDLVVSDGDLPGLLAARLTRTPALAIGHGLLFWCCDPPSWVPSAAWRRERRKAGRLCRVAHRQIAVNFTPMPVRRGRVVRPTLDLPSSFAWREGKSLVCYLRDRLPNGIAQDLAALGHPVTVFAASDPHHPGIEWRPLSRAAYVEALATAKAVIASAGSQTISECAALGIPLFAIHARDHDEQMLNVAMLRHAGLGDGCSVEDLSRDRLAEFLDRPAPPKPDPDEPDLVEAVFEEAEALLRHRRLSG